ncbi:MAG: hypothetical protein K5739_07690 [Lachnospiraceae bacterium]|nr:hypothetical protein [Lachnospiraceae bacterium]
MLVIQSVFAFMWMCVMPFLAGCVFLPLFAERKEGHYILSTVSGIMLHYSVYEFFALFGKWANWGLLRVTFHYAAVALILTIMGCVSMWKHRSLFYGKVLSPVRGNLCFWAGVFFILLQMAAVLLMATPDLDDAFYSGVSAMALARDELLQIDAYDGLMRDPMGKRYMISALPLYQSSLALLSCNMHPLIIAHNLFPLFYIPVSYGLFYRIGSDFLEADETKEKEEKTGAKGRFLLLIALMHMFGNYYVFSPENFLVTRLWQGKALFVALGIPFLWILISRSFSLQGKKKRILMWILVMITMVAGSFMGETGLYLGPVLCGCITVSGCIVNKKLRPVFGALLSCIPQAGLLLILLLTGA